MPRPIKVRSFLSSDQRPEETIGCSFIDEEHCEPILDQRKSWAEADRENKGGDQRLAAGRKAQPTIRAKGGRSLMNCRQRLVYFSQQI